MCPGALARAMETAATAACSRAACWLPSRGLRMHWSGTGLSRSGVNVCVHSSGI